MGWFGGGAGGPNGWKKGLTPEQLALAAVKPNTVEWSRGKDPWKLQSVTDLATLERGLLNVSGDISKDTRVGAAEIQANAIKSYKARIAELGGAAAGGGGGGDLSGAPDTTKLGSDALTAAMRAAAKQRKKATSAGKTLLGRGSNPAATLTPKTLLGY